MKKNAVATVVLGMLCAVCWGNPGFYSGNGRIEATEIMISAKQQNRIVKINVKEGDYVEAGQVLVEMDTKLLRAKLEQTKASKSLAEAMVEVRCGELEVAKAALAKCESNLKNAKQDYDRQTELLKAQVTTTKHFDEAQTAYRARQAEYEAAAAAVKQAEALVMVAKANINVVQAEMLVIQAEIDDCYLVAPVAGRIQRRLAKIGEVVGAGADVISLTEQPAD